MKAEHIAQAVAQERPDVIALSFLSTTTYPAVKRMARRLKSEAPGYRSSSADFDSEARTAGLDDGCRTRGAGPSNGARDRLAATPGGQ